MSSFRTYRVFARTEVIKNQFRTNKVTQCLTGALAASLVWAVTLIFM